MKDKLCLLKRISKEIKLGVVLTDVVMTLYVGWLIFTDTTHWLPGTLFSWTPLGIVLLLRANKLLGLCLTHKLMIYHSGLVYMCCVYQAYYGFGCTLPYFRWIMFITGLLLILNLSIKQCCKSN